MITTQQCDIKHENFQETYDVGENSEVLMTVKTPFQFRLLSSSNKNKNLKVDCLPSFDISPYEIFCLRSILITELERVMGIPITVKFLRIFPDSQDIYIRVLTPEKTNKGLDSRGLGHKTLKILQQLINSIISGPRDFCILFRYDMGLEIDFIHVPYRWLQDMIPLVAKNLLKGYDYKLKGGDIYIRLDDTKFQETQIDYLMEYDNLQRLLLSYIKKLFRKGTLKFSKDQKDFAQKWAQKWLLRKVCELETGDEIYEAQWFDKRFFNEESGENMTKFLLNRLKKDYVFIPDIKFSSTQYRTEICSIADDINTKPDKMEISPLKKTETRKRIGTKVYIDNLEDLWYLYGHLRHIEKNVYN